MQDVGPPRNGRVPERQAVILIAAFSLMCFALAFWAVYVAIDAMILARTWESKVATIVEIDAPRLSRGGPYYPVRLRVDDHRGDWVTRWAERDLTLPWRRSWSESRRFPTVGDRIAVYVAPAPPFHIMPASALSSELWAGILLVLMFLPSGGFFLWHAVMAWRRAKW